MFAVFTHTFTTYCFFTFVSGCVTSHCAVPDCCGNSMEGSSRFVYLSGASAPASARSGGRTMVTNTESVRVFASLVTVTVTGKGIGSYRMLTVFAVMAGTWTVQAILRFAGGTYTRRSQITGGALSNSAMVRSRTLSATPRGFAASCQVPRLVPAGASIDGVAQIVSEAGDMRRTAVVSYSIRKRIPVAPPSPLFVTFIDTGNGRGRYVCEPLSHTT